ncbi:AbrB/MazE/SpoVT family DNA-binding domain-containing protein [Candidatus Woesearchaeota archaeon]|nr:AbrB/MazE/SpoVT family DNA-binding domain-containing protein [Candidatus Woesearchaeota archaeon]
MGIKFIGKAKITKQGQVTLPFEARNELNIASDSEIYWYLIDDFLVVVKDLVSTEDLGAVISGKKRNKKK